MNELRPYRDEGDLQAMMSILEKGRGADSAAYYVHTGDLKWWLFYLDPDFEQRIFLYEENGQVQGWVLFSPRFKALDVFVLPDLVLSELRLKLFSWAEERLSQQVRASGGKTICTMWVSERDAALIRHLEGHGFARSEGTMMAMRQPLEGELPEPALPAGFHLRHVTGEAEAPLRAAASHAAFESSKTIEAYTSGYVRWMRSPAYVPEQDIVAEAPDGSFAAFCFCWLDDVNRVGYFEPVGTHPGFQKKGLARAVIYEGLRLMKARGMKTAGVCVESDNPAAIKLYESTGFHPQNKILAFEKPL